MVLGLRLACLCLYTPPIAQEFRATSLAFVSAVSTRPSSRLAMSSTGVGANNSSVGLADIGRTSKENANINQDMSWRTLLEHSYQKSRKDRGSNYVQLATVDAETQEPRVRSVVFRGFLNLPKEHFNARELDELSCVMKMVTDDRSKKVQQVMRHPSRSAELHWWFPKSNEQYRVQGQLLFVGGGNFEHDGDKVLSVARKEAWGNLSDSARESFLYEQVPGDIFEEATSCESSGGRDSDRKVVPPPENFLLMLLLPKQCDYLRLGAAQYRQVDSLSEGKWCKQRVNP
jgi:pyridoxamine 5'-phosphate oxidase